MCLIIWLVIHHHSTHYWLDCIVCYFLYLVSCNVLLFQIQICYNETNLTIDITLHTIIKYPISHCHNVYLLQIQICCHKAVQLQISHSHSHKIFLYLVLMFIYCRYISTFTQLVTLQMLHCTPSFNFFISHRLNFCVLQILSYI
jgi:hypothetical protein